MGYLQGKYHVKNPQKYAGNAEGVVYRSSYELKFMNFLDRHPNVVRWASEEFFIPYTWNGEPHRYFPDFLIEFKSADGEIKKMVVEIKPSHQTHPPQAPKRQTRKALEVYENAIATYTKNISKWEAAKKFCEKNGAKFIVLTENELFKGNFKSKK